MSEQDQEQVIKHVCRLCNKSFPCGRSLGGHMRSHVINPTDHHHHLLDHHKKKLLPSLINNGETNINEDAKYGLRENPKKTCKFKDSSETHDDEAILLVHDKFCKECGRGFQSWKALFGHMKCHSDKISSNSCSTTNFQHDSWTSSQSDNENLGKNPHRKRRTSRRIKRYNLVVSATAATCTTTTTTTSSSISTMNPTNNRKNNSVTELIEQELEEEEVALCLMMLSRDVGLPWGTTGTVDFGESSDNNSAAAFVQADLVKLAKIEGKSSGSSPGHGELVKMKKLKKSGFSKIPRSGSKIKKSETQLGDFLGKAENELGLVKEDELLGAKSFGSIKRKSSDNSSSTSILDLLLDTNQDKSKYECTTCNKSFHSYQALGGHRASHKKFKTCCFDSRAEMSIEADQIDHNNSEVIVVQTSPNSKKVQGNHECPICFRVFSSGQALGGHKRSHLIAEAKINNTQNGSGSIAAIQKPIRDFLDLNMPAPIDQEEISSSATTGYKPWWAEINHKHESLVGLIS